MQVTIYLSDNMIRTIDRMAKSEGKSRSAVVQELLQSGMKGKQAVPTRTLSAFGAWKEGGVPPLKEIRRHAARDIARVRLK